MDFLRGYVVTIFSVTLVLGTTQGWDLKLHLCLLALYGLSTWYRSLGVRGLPGQPYPDT